MSRAVTWRNMSPKGTRILESIIMKEEIPEFMMDNLSHQQLIELLIKFGDR